MWSLVKKPQMKKIAKITFDLLHMADKEMNILDWSSGKVENDSFGEVGGREEEKRDKGEKKRRAKRGEGNREGGRLGQERDTKCKYTQ